MVLTAILTAIHSRLGVFAGVHCRTDSLRVRISGHRRTAADASPVTYKHGVSSSSLLAPTLKAPSERPVSEHVRTSGWPDRLGLTTIYDHLLSPSASDRRASASRDTSGETWP